MISNAVLAESYYFKECQLNQNTIGDYTIDLDKKVITLNLKVEDGTSQEVIDEIEMIEDDKIISKKLKVERVEIAILYII